MANPDLAKLDAIARECRVQIIRMRSEGASPSSEPPQDSVARAKPALGADDLRGARLVNGLMRAFSDSSLASIIRE